MSILSCERDEIWTAFKQALEGWTTYEADYSALFQNFNQSCILFDVRELEDNDVLEEAVKVEHTLL